MSCEPATQSTDSIHRLNVDLWSTFSRVWFRTLIAGLLITVPKASLALNPPPAAPNWPTPCCPIYGGTTLAPSGRIYAAVFEIFPNTKPQIRTLNPNGSAALPPINLLAGDNAWHAPSLSPDGTRLYVATERGRVYCFNTINNQQVWMHEIIENPQLQTLDLPAQIRSGVAYRSFCKYHRGGEWPRHPVWNCDGYQQHSPH